jgi:hypothetical protein
VVLRRPFRIALRGIGIRAVIEQELDYSRIHSNYCCSQERIIVDSRINRLAITELVLYIRIKWILKSVGKERMGFLEGASYEFFHESLCRSSADRLRRSSHRSSLHNSVPAMCIHPVED